MMKKSGKRKDERGRETQSKLVEEKRERESNERLWNKAKEV